MPTRRETLKSAAAFAAAGALPLRLRPATPPDSALPEDHARGENPADTSEPVSLYDFEPLAKAKMSHAAWEYVNGGAGDELTVRWNREALDRIRLKPRVLVDVSKPETSVTLLGREMPFPILLAPTASHRAYHAEGELATARAAGAAGATMVLSTLSNTSVEDVVAAAKSPVWF
jgi:4-hydroxymandelate oxidase